MKNTKPLFLFLFFMAFQLSFGQYGAQKKGDYFFSQFSYSKAIKEYEKMIKGDLNPSYAHQQLAECYLLMRDYKKSIPHFEAIINNAMLPTDYYFKYAMALYTDGQHKLSEKYLRKYKKYNKNDSRVKRFLKDGNLASVVFNSRQRFDLEPVPFNSSESDFGVFEREGMLYFASSRKDAVEGEVYGWNEEPWLDLFQVQEDNPMSIPRKIPGTVTQNFMKVH